MLDILVAAFFVTIVFAVFFRSFIGLLISIAILDFYKVIFFIAKAGVGWDYARKIVEIQLKGKARNFAMPRWLATRSVVH